MIIEKYKADWSHYERRPTWSLISSRELSKVFGASLQTINNWNVRGLLPAPFPKVRHLPAGNRNWFVIAKVRALFEGRTEEDIHWEWCRKFIDEPITTLAQAEYYVTHIPNHFGVEKPLITGNF